MSKRYGLLYDATDDVEHDLLAQDEARNLGLEFLNWGKNKLLAAMDVVEGEGPDEVDDRILAGFAEEFQIKLIAKPDWHTPDWPKESE